MTDSFITELAQRFCAAPLPDTVCADPCASMPGYPIRSGTNLLTVAEAEQVFAYIMTQKPEQPSGYSGHGRHGASLGFEGGNLYIRIAGHGASDGTGAIAFPGADLEMDGDGYYTIELPNSELIAIRDILNKWFPASPIERGDAVKEHPSNEFARLICGMPPASVDAR